MTQADLFAEQAYKLALERARDRSFELEGPSLAERIARLPRKQRDEVLASLDVAQRARLAHEWAFWARPKQRPANLPPHRVLLWMSGRGFGKSRSGAERIRERVESGARSIALIGPTTTDIERFMLGVGTDDEGLLNVFPPHQRPKYLGAPKNLVLFHTGAIAYIVTAERPEFRGANLDTVWGDEIAKWRYLSTIWNNVELATRKRPASGIDLEIILTTTPRRLRFLKQLIADEDVVTILGAQRENAANLDPKFVARMQRRLGGSRLGRQEIEGELLDDNPGAMFRSDDFDAYRVLPEATPRNLRVVIAVDPGIATNPENDQTGIVVIGIDDDDGHLYVLEDLTEKSKPDAWGRSVIEAFDKWRAVAVVGERNRGGDLVEANVRACYERKRGLTAAASLTFVNVHATRGKDIRAEPVASLSKNGMLHIVGALPELETEVTEWDPTIGDLDDAEPSPDGVKRKRQASPNRLDAMVWGAWHLAGLDDDLRPDHSRGMLALPQLTQALKGQTSPPRPVMSPPTSVPTVNALRPFFRPGGGRKI